MLSILKDCLTGKDGESYDVARVLLCISGLSFIAMSVYAVWHSGTFDPDKFGSGIGWMLGGGGVGIGVKSHTEPQSTEPQS